MQVGISPAKGQVKSKTTEEQLVYALSTIEQRNILAVARALQVLTVCKMVLACVGCNLWQPLDTDAQTTTADQTSRERVGKCCIEAFAAEQLLVPPGTSSSKPFSLNCHRVTLSLTMVRSWICGAAVLAAMDRCRYLNSV